MINAHALCFAITLLSQEGVLKLSEQGVEVACDNAEHIVKYSKEANFDPALIAALIYVESRFTPTAVSRAGACGLTQVLPKYSRPKSTCDQLKDPETSIKAGITALSYWKVKRKKKRIQEALACYNAGNKCLESKNGTSYSKIVLRKYRQIKRATTVEGCECEQNYIDFKYLPFHTNKVMIASLRQ